MSEAQKPPSETSQRSAPPTSPAALAAPASPATIEISAAWRSALAEWLQQHKTYPEGARSEGAEGRVTVRFTIDRDGRVLDVALVRSSGAPILDEAAQAMLRGARLPPFPPGMTQDRVTVTLPIRYGLEP
jgi:protein TonB